MLKGTMDYIAAGQFVGALYWPTIYAEDSSATTEVQVEDQKVVELPLAEGAVKTASEKTTIQTNNLNDYQSVLEAAISEGSDPAVVEADYRRAAGLEPATEETSLVPAAIAAAAASNPEAANTAMGNALMNHSRGRNRQRGQNHGRGQQHRNRGDE